MNLVEQVRLAGVGGAGGGGFPTHVKLARKADTVIANSAECEPFLHKDAAVMEHEATAMVRGIQLAMEAVSAATGASLASRRKTNTPSRQSKPRARARPSACICSVIIIRLETNTIGFTKPPAG